MIKKAAKLMRQSQYIVVLTGAGISTESGLPDFRSNGGLWDGKEPETISHYSAVGTEEFQQFFSKRIENIDAHAPNLGHEILAKWENEGRIKAIVTQNIDSYHQKAGNEKVIEMHGHLRYLSCNECGRKYSNAKYVQQHDDYCEEEGCKGIVRPEVVLFGEYLPEDDWYKAILEVRKADLVIVLGTSLQVFPFNTLVERAHADGAKIIIITQSKTPYDHMASVRLHEPIGRSLRLIDKSI